MYVVYQLTILILKLRCHFPLYVTVTHTNILLLVVEFC